MEKVATAGISSTGLHRELRVRACAALALCVACTAVWAQDAAQAPAEMLLAQVDPGMRVQVQTSTLPRMEAQDTGFQAARVDVALYPSGATGLGAVIGMSGFAPRQATQLAGLQARPSFDLGVRWTQRLQSQQVDITAWRRMSNDDDAYSLVQSRQPVYGARVEMDLAPGNKNPFAAERGFIGLQLEGGAKISFKRKDGRPMVYYRNMF